MTRMDIAFMLKQARKEAKVKVNKVAEILQNEFDITVSPKTIYGWEVGRGQPDLITFFTLCRIYHIEPNAFRKITEL